MKTIYNSFIISIIAILLTSFNYRTSDNIKSVILKTGDNKATPELLNQSSGIISARLNSYGLKSFEIKVAADKSEIEVRVPDNTNLSEIEGLFTSGGELSFYETQVLKGVKGTDRDDSNLTNARIGCTGFEDPGMVAKAEAYLKSENLASSTRLFWSVKNDKSQFCLYALKVDNEGKALMSASDVEVVSSVPEKDSESSRIEIKFRKEAAGKWERATGENINKPIAIVVGNKVFYAPVVRDAIKSGLCEITGNMTQKEVGYFLALVNNEPLPLSFKIIR